MCGAKDIGAEDSAECLLSTVEAAVPRLKIAHGRIFEREWLKLCFDWLPIFQIISGSGDKTPFSSITYFHLDKISRVSKFTRKMLANGKYATMQFGREFTTCGSRSYKELSRQSLTT